MRRSLFAGLLSLCLAFATPAVADTLVPTVVFGGAFEKPFILTREELASIPHELIAVKDHGTPAKFEGVALLDLLRRAGAPMDEALRGPNLAKYLLVTASDGYHAVFSLAEIDEAFGKARVYLVDMRDNKPLDDKQGPFRLVVVGDERAGRWVRQVTRIELIDAAPKK